MAGSKLEGEEETVIPARVKLADIAEIASVSTATVSRVLNEKPGVAETTRASVLAALEALGVRRLDVGQQISPGVSWLTGRTAAGRQHNFVLKSGNFGPEDLFVCGWDLLT